MITDFTLARRVCLPCDIASPYSSGFATSICSTCENLAESIERAEPHEQYMYKAACLKVVEPAVEPEPEPIPDPDNEGETVPVDDAKPTEDVEEKPDEEEEIADDEEEVAERPDIELREEPDPDEGGNIADGSQITIDTTSEEENSLMKWLILGIVVIAVSLICFISYKCYKSRQVGYVKKTQITDLTSPREKSKPEAKKSKKERK